MPIISASSSANLSAEFLKTNTSWPALLRNDYISRSSDAAALFENDIFLDARLTEAEGKITSLEARIEINEANIASIDSRLTIAESDIATNAASILTNASNISANAAGISENGVAISEINDGRYSPQFGTGSPEGSVTANRSQTYFDASVPSMWVNPTIGASTGWVQVV